MHHGDGVEEAFCTSNWVMTVFFSHQYGDFFPGTGDVKDCDVGEGQNFSLNASFWHGIDDESFLNFFIR